MNTQRLDERSTGLVLTASLDNLVFEGKNRTYGAYQMRSSETRRLMASTYFTAAIVLIITLILFFRFNLSDGPEANNFVPVTNEVYEAKIMPIPEPPVIDDVKPPVEKAAVSDPAPAQPDPLPTQAVLIPEPSPVAEDTSTIIDQGLIKNPGAVTSDGGGTPTMDPPGTGGTGTGTGGPEPITELDETNPDFFKATQPVVLNLDKIKGKLIYPRQLLEAEYEGDVVLKILVDENGAYKSHKVLKSSHVLFQKEVESRKKWSPGLKIWLSHLETRAGEMCAYG